MAVGYFDIAACLVVGTDPVAPVERDLVCAVAAVLLAAVCTVVDGS